MPFSTSSSACRRRPSRGWAPPRRAPSGATDHTAGQPSSEEGSNICSPCSTYDDVKRVEVALTREGVSVAELMRRAGLAAPRRRSLELGAADNVVALVGLGNNGGDGWVAAEALRTRNGANVTVVTPDRARRALAGDLAQARWPRAAVRVRRPHGVVAPLPRRARGPARHRPTWCSTACSARASTATSAPPFDIWIECVNACPARVVAVDVPSGLSSADRPRRGAPAWSPT